MTKDKKHDLIKHKKLYFFNFNHTQTMNKFYSIAAFAAICCASVSLSSCNAKSNNPQPTEKDSTSVVKTEAEPETYMTAVDRFLVEKKGSQYYKGEDSLKVVCIPCGTVVAADENDSTDIKVWGNFEVYNYLQSGDTLKTVSGGSHPGLMHVKKSNGHFEVTSFEAVEDGSNYLPSAKRIFGDKFAEFQKISSDNKKREEVRKTAIAGYAKKNGITATMYQDYGWDPVKF